MSYYIKIPCPGSTAGYERVRLIKVIRTGSEAPLSLDEKIMLSQYEEIEALKEQNAMLTVQVQEGWKLVPVEPTQAMHDSWMYGKGPWSERYRAMLAAAPTPPQQVKSEDVRDGTQLPGGVSNGLSAQD